MKLMIITQKIQEREISIVKKTTQRAELLEILKSHGALEERTRLEERHTEKFSMLKELNQRIDNLKAI